jgi:WD40 repeat protein
MLRLHTLLLSLFVIFAFAPAHAQDAASIPPPPVAGEVITPANAERLELFSTLGRGIIQDMAWSPDERLFMVTSSIGVWLYDDFDAEPFLIEGAGVLIDQDWTTLAIQNRGQIDVWSLETREKRVISLPAGQEISRQSRMVMSADGEMLYFYVYSPQGYTLWQWDIPRHQLKGSIDYGDRYVFITSISPRGDALLISTSDSTSLLLLNDTREAILLYRAEGSQPEAFVFHPTQPVLAYYVRSSAESTVYFYNYETRQETVVGSVSPSTLTLFFSPDGNRLLARVLQAEQGELYMWELNTGSQTSGRGALNIPYDFSTEFSPDGRYLVIRDDYRSEIWDLGTFETIEPAWTGGNLYGAIRFSPDGDYVAVGGALYALDSGDLLREIPGYTNTAVFSPGGEQVAVVDPSANAVNIHPTATEGEQLQLRGYGTHAMLGFDAQGQQLLTVSGRTLTLWDLSQSETLMLELPQTTFPLQRQSDVNDQVRLNSYDIDNSTLLQWSLELSGSVPVFSEAQTFEFRDELPVDPGARVTGYTLSPDGRLFVARGGEDADYYDGTPYLFVRDLVTGRYTVVYGHSGQINDVAFSPDGNILATGSGYITEYYQSEDTSLRLWDVSHVNGSPHLSERVRFQYNGVVEQVVFSASGRLIAADTWEKLSVRDTVTGAEMFEYETYATYDLALSPDEQLLIADTNSELKVWNLQTGELLTSLPIGSGYVMLSIDPQGRWIAVAESGVVRLYGVRGS